MHDKHARMCAHQQEGDQVIEAEYRLEIVKKLFDELTMEEINQRAAQLFKPITTFMDKVRAHDMEHIDNVFMYMYVRYACAHDLNICVMAY
jgi:hypothetical protein